MGRLVCIMTIHVDDLKIAGEPHIVREILKVIEEVFGELTIQKGTFTNCGVQHTQNPITHEITLDQIHFISALRPISHPQLTAAASEEKCVPDLASLFLSLLGAIAYVTHTRVDIMVFIVALQRHNHDPQVLHVKRLNKLLMWGPAAPKEVGLPKVSLERERVSVTPPHHLGRRVQEGNR